MFLFLKEGWPALLLTAAVAYLLGSVSFAIIVTRAFSHKDIRDFGSGNAGATNVLRSQGKVPALLTTLGDLAKSALSVAIGGWLMVNLTPSTYDPDMLSCFGCYLAGLFCVLGHMHPIFFGFRGGKGVMTTLGMMLLLDWRVALILLTAFGLVVMCTRMVSLGSIVAAIGLPILTYVFRFYVDGKGEATAWFCTAVTAAIAVIVIIKHRSNIGRILKGTENKI